MSTAATFYRYLILLNAVMAGINFGMYARGYGVTPLVVGMGCIVAIVSGHLTVLSIEKEAAK